AGHARAGDRALHCGGSAAAGAGLGRHRRAHVAGPGAHRRAGRPRPGPGGRAAGEPRAGRPRGPLDGGAGGAGPPQQQHPVRRYGDAGARGGHVPVRTAHRAGRQGGPVRRPEALLVLEDGRTFRGEAYGSVGETFGEAVFTTAMTGYQETLTDPSYHRQVVVQTAPHIGNTGVNGEDDESARIWVAGYAVRDPARTPSNWRSSGGLEDRLAAEGVVGICGIDTRALTRHLRERGAMRVGVSSVERDPVALLKRVRAAPAMVGADLSAEVSTPT